MYKLQFSLSFTAGRRLEPILCIVFRPHFVKFSFRIMSYSFTGVIIIAIASTQIHTYGNTNTHTHHLNTASHFECHASHESL